MAVTFIDGGNWRDT